MKESMATSRFGECGGAPELRMSQFDGGGGDEVGCVLGAGCAGNDGQTCDGRVRSTYRLSRGREGGDWASTHEAVGACSH